VWAVSDNVPLSTLGNLLRILSRFHPRLPVDARTLLQTSRQAVDIVQLQYDGQYCHVGIAENIQRLYANGSLEKCLDEGVISLQVHIDGMSVYKSSGYQLWPILGIVKGSTNKTPFTIGPSQLQQNT
jgi:hypothetical protein